MRRARAIPLLLLTVSVAAVAVSWPILRDQSALSVSYSISVVGTETPLVDAYETISADGYFRQTATRLVAEAKDDAMRLETLMSWAHENVRPQYAAPGRLVRDNFYDIVRRGSGFCDQTAHVFATLATFAGYDARLWFLMNDRGESPHTVAEVLVDGRWVVVDPWQGIVWQGRDGRLLGTRDATSELLTTWGYDRWGVALRYFQQGTEFRTFPYQSPLAFAQKVVSKIAGLPVAPEPASIGLSPVTGPSGTEPVSAESLRAILLRYDEARRAHLEADYDRAPALYEELLGASIPPDLRDEAEFFRGLALLRGGRPSEAIAAWDIAERDGVGGWVKSLLQYRGEAKELMGDLAGARADYARADTPPTARRLARLAGVAGD